MSWRIVLIFAIMSWPALAFAAPDDGATRMEEIIQSAVGRHEFMGAVLVTHDASTIVDKGYGSANLEWNIPNSPTTKFRLGSITKQFTAAAILLLQERGKLNVNDPVKKYLADAPPSWDKVTLFHLLTHTSGIPDFTNFPDYPANESLATTPAELVARFRDKPLESVPGEKFNYSNSNFVLLGIVLEHVSGAHYCDFLQRNIFTPLAMKDSGCDSNTRVISQRASGYSPAAPAIENAGFIHMSIPFAAGSLYSTTGDLLRWERGLFGAKILSAASLKQMTTPYKGDYAFGLSIDKRNGHDVVEHGGGIEGFNAQMSYFPKDKIAVIVLGNLNGSAPENLAAKLARVAFGQRVILPNERKATKVASTLLAKYVGSYHLSPTFALAITLEGDQLFARATGQEKLPIFPESDTSFFLKDVDAQIEFVVDTAGHVTHLVLHQNGRDRKGERK